MSSVDGDQPWFAWGCEDKKKIVCWQSEKMKGFGVESFETATRSGLPQSSSSGKLQ